MKFFSRTKASDRTGVVRFIDHNTPKHTAVVVNTEWHMVWCCQRFTIVSAMNEKQSMIHGKL
jgi:hypothetical protein